VSPQGYQSLLTSLRQKVLSLPDETVILPGHGPTTTVGEEKHHNPFF
jgi:glyoxylase-like metal-dependent hydrolase (beta-lactamase superfamily II)